MAREDVVLLALIATVAAVAIFALATLVSGSGCPSGQHRVQTGVRPEWVNGEPVMIPQYACEGGS